MPKAILVIDVQNGFLNETTRHIPGRIKMLLDRVAFEHRIFTRFHNLPGSPYETLLDWRRLRSDEEIRLAAELHDYPTTVVDKSVYSCMNSAFLDYAGLHGLTEFYIAGIDTDSCVLKCAVDLFEAGYTPKVLTDCCMSHGGIRAHEAALTILPRFIGSRQIIGDAFAHFGVQAPE